MDDTARSCERITVTLLPKATADLRRLRERTGRSKTDLVNRAITLYELTDARMRDGRDLVLRDRETGETELIRFL